MPEHLYTHKLWYTCEKLYKIKIKKENKVQSTTKHRNQRTQTHRHTPSASRTRSTHQIRNEKFLKHTICAVWCTFYCLLHCVTVCVSCVAGVQRDSQLTLSLSRTLFFVFFFYALDCIFYPSWDLVGNWHENKRTIDCSVLVSVQ